MEAPDRNDAEDKSQPEHSCSAPYPKTTMFGPAQMLCAVLLYRLSVGGSSPLEETVVSGQWTQNSPWEGEAPAEPKLTARGPLSLFANNRSPRHSCSAPSPEKHWGFQG
jgi:hypothetical protein